MPKTKKKENAGDRAYRLVGYANDASERARTLERDHERNGIMRIGSKVAADSHNHVQNLRQSEAEDQRERARRNTEAAMGKTKLDTRHNKY